MKRSRATLAFGGALGLFAFGCSPGGTGGQAFVFFRPEHLEFVCYAPNAPANHSDYVVLPRTCCASPDPSRDALISSLPEHCRTQNGAVLGTPVLHALVTQSTRGEVAAVDLEDARVLDSERTVPGFTFIDSGGLPSAIVAPPWQPRAAASVSPAWVYVASAEEYQVRAIATCRFRSGRACGPELEGLNGDENARNARTRVPLPAAPHDMVLGPDSALWLTLPDLALIARIELGANEANPAAALDAFAMATELEPRPPQYYRIPAEPSAQPREPIAEADEYLLACGLNYQVQPRRLTLPLAPRTPPTSAVHPTRLRFDPSSGLALVADGVAPVLHAFAPAADGTLTALGALPTGAPLRDFVLTPEVPALEPDLKAMPSAGADPTAPSKRYLYGIDERGLVMVFEFSIVAGVPQLQPLLVPAPGVGYADRIELPSPALTLEVIDTRPRSDYVCGEDASEGSELPIETLRRRESDLRRNLVDATEPPELQQVEARVDIYENASASHLRGVFVVVAAASGALSVIDVYDLDAPCRARKECCSGAVCTGDDDLLNPRDTGTTDGLALRRHAVRRSSAGDPDAAPSDVSKLEPFTAAEDQLVLDEVAAVPKDPWSLIGQTWSARYRAALPNSALADATFEPGSDATQLVLRAPAEVDLCARGIEVVENDLVAVTGDAPEHLREDCPDPTEGSEQLLRITEAYRDRLVVTPEVPATVDPVPAQEEIVARLRRCYPDFVSVELRAGGFVLTGTTAGAFLHRVTADESGACVEDTTKDPLLNARPERRENGSYVFQNPYVAFTLRAPSGDTDPSSGNVAVQIQNASSALQINAVSASAQTIDALPASVRYQPESGELFVLDSATQELLRFTLTPFRHDGTNFR